MNSWIQNLEIPITMDIKINKDPRIHVKRWENRIEVCMNRNLPWSGPSAQKYILRHRSTVLSLVWLIMMYNIFLGPGTDPWDISVHTRANDYQASRFFYAATIIAQRSKYVCVGRATETVPGPRWVSFWFYRWTELDMKVRWHKMCKQ